MNFLQQRLNQGNAAAANNVTNWSGTCYITPLIGAFLADSYLGRYWTIASFSIIYTIVSNDCLNQSSKEILQLFCFSNLIMLIPFAGNGVVDNVCFRSWTKS